MGNVSQLLSLTDAEKDGGTDKRAVIVAFLWVIALTTMRLPFLPSSFSHLWSPRTCVTIEQDVHHHLPHATGRVMDEHATYRTCWRNSLRTPYANKSHNPTHTVHHYYACMYAVNVEGRLHFILGNSLWYGHM